MYFFLLVLGILLNLDPDIGHKQGRFFKTLLERSFEFVPSKKSGPVALNFGFILLPMEVNPISEKQSRKKNALIADGIGYVKMILALLIKVAVLYMQAFIIQIRILCF